MINFVKFDAAGKLVATSRCERYDEILPIEYRAGFEPAPAEISPMDRGYCKKVNGVIVIDTEMKNAEIQQRNWRAEMQQIEQWFCGYDRKVSEHNRCCRLNVPCHHDIAELDREAAVKQQRLKQLQILWETAWI